MRTEKDLIGEMQVPENALYGIHAARARENFPDCTPFSIHWYRAMGEVKLACYDAYASFCTAVRKEFPDKEESLRLMAPEKVKHLQDAAREVADGLHFSDFIVPAVQGGAGTSINMNINEIIANVALIKAGGIPGDYQLIDPLESANVFQSTNDTVPTALAVAVIRLLNTLEAEINTTRSKFEELETRYRRSLRLAYTQMQEAVPATWGQLFSSYSDALSRDWWRVSKGFERIKAVNLGGGATGSGVSIPRYFIMEVVPALKRLTALPLTQAENLTEATSNLDKWVEVHAILKAHAVNLEKAASDLRLLSAGILQQPELRIAPRQAGSSIMPGKINPVISEFVISSAHHVYTNDTLLTALAGQGCLELNAYLPSVGHAILNSLDLLIAMNRTFSSHLLNGLEINEELSAQRLWSSPAITTALSPFIGYHKAGELAERMKAFGEDIFEANRSIQLIDHDILERITSPDNLLKKGFSLRDSEEAH
ncbi:MAG: lyase family protein [Bacteroidota bacterium]